MQVLLILGGIIVGLGTAFIIHGIFKLFEQVIDMGRAERRRSGLKNKVRTYTLTDVEIAKIKQEAVDEAINTAMTLLFVLPMEVLMDNFWKKTYAKKIPEFTEHLLEYYRAWQDGELDMDKMKEDLWTYGGIRLEESD